MAFPNNAPPIPATPAPNIANGATADNATVPTTPAINPPKIDFPPPLNETHSGLDGALL